MTIEGLLRFQCASSLQQALLFLGALDAYRPAHFAPALPSRLFNGLRFQRESLSAIRWMARSSDDRERQHRAYEVTCGLLTRWADLLFEDAGDDQAAFGRLGAAR